jgi:fructose PTS system EIIBC or EIIC component
MTFPQLDNANALLLLAVIVAAGAAGTVAARLVRVPAITGQVVFGALLGFTLLRDIHAAAVLQPLSTFAMGLIAVAVGGHLSYRRIRSAMRRIVGIALLESAFAAIAVTTASYLVTGSEIISVLLGSIAVATAPATTFALIRETRSKGTFVKTLLSVVAIDNILCIMLFSFVLAIVGDVVQNPDGNVRIATAIGHASVQFLGALLLGGIAGLFVEIASTRMRGHDFGIGAAAILICSGLATCCGLNPLLANLFLGVYLGNRSVRTERQLNALHDLEAPLYLCFFTLAGTALHFDSLAEAGLLVLAYLGARAGGKSIGALLGGRLFRVSPRITNNAALALWPQAGVAIGLVVLLEGNARLPETLAQYVGTVVLATVTVNEIVGPFFTRAALRRANEAGRDRPRLVEFLEEEHILMDIEAKDKWDALRQLSAFFAQVYRCTPEEAAAVEASVFDRERNFTTAVGMGAAIPHGRIADGHAIEGVLGISRKGIDFDAPDGEPVKLMMLIVTPKDHEQRHLDVMASLVAMISHEGIRNRLAAAIDANDAWEIIEDEEARPFNYFLEDQEEERSSDL